MNSPKRTLLDLFRSWLPQTAANLKQRLAALDALIKNGPDVAFDLLDRIVNVGHDVASPSVRPSWRDDDTGAGRGVTPHERLDMLVAAADRLVACARGNSLQVTKLLNKIEIFDPARVAETLALVEEFVHLAKLDEDRETLRDVLRRKIHWHYNYDNHCGGTLKNLFSRLENLYEQLAPTNLIARYRWLF